MLLCKFLCAQQSTQVPFLSFTPADTLHKGRFWLATGTTTALYTGTVVALNSAWYQQYDRTSFHFFDDHREWHGMDKMGHLYTAYFESLWAYELAKWTGMQEHKAVWTGAALGMIFQSTVEVLDGFSSEWGFSAWDEGFNVVGAGTFVLQQKLWGEQRIHLKVSSTPIDYPDFTVTAQNGEMTTLNERTEALFGKSFPERFLKDYNAQTTWLSVNVKAFLNNPRSRFPAWLNVAVGYGAENMYGGFENMWTDDETGAIYRLPDDPYKRYSQFYLSPDIDFSRIPTKSPALRTLLGMLNVFKMPGPVLEMSGQEGVKVKLRW